MKTLFSRSALMACGVAVLGFQIPASAQTSQADVAFVAATTQTSTIVINVAATTHSSTTVDLPVTNFGMDDATNTIVTLNPPKGMKVSWPSTQNCVLSHLGQGQTAVACNLGTVVVGATTDFSFDVSSNRSGLDGFSVNVSSDAIDTVMYNNSVYMAITFQ